MPVPGTVAPVRSDRSTRRLLVAVTLSAAASGAAASGAVSAGAGASARAEAPAGTSLAPVRLPADAAPHHDPVEWWYFNGHLSGRDRSGKLHRYGFEDVVFQFFLLGPKPVYVGNFAVTDLERHTFSYGGRQQGGTAVPATPGRFALRTGTWTMSGTGARDLLSASMPSYSLHLRLAATHGPTMEGPRGVVSLGPFGTSWYYSYTSLRTTGTVVDHGLTVPVTGNSWMDHEWGSIDVLGGAGWDWFSIQLSDGRQYMLEFIRDKSGKIVQSLGTRSSAKGAAQLPAGSFAEAARGSWRSPASHISYPSGWRLTVPGGHLSVVPDLKAQEVLFKTIGAKPYWEGDCTVSGVIGGKAVSGAGYTELNPPGVTGI